MGGFDYIFCGGERSEEQGASWRAIRAGGNTVPALTPKLPCSHDYVTEQRPFESRLNEFGDQDFYVVSLRRCRICGDAEVDRRHVGTSLPWLSPNYTGTH